MTRIDAILSKFEHSPLKHVFLEGSHESFSSEVGFTCKAFSSYAGSFANVFYMFNRERELNYNRHQAVKTGVRHSSKDSKMIVIVRT
jgi:hypothetical protein